MPTVIPPSKLEFKSEAPPRNAPGRLSTVHAFKGTMAALAEHQDKWAIVATGEKSYTAQRLRAEYPDFEIVARSEEPGVPFAKAKHTIWACFRGPQYFLNKAEEARQRATTRSAASE